jgi:hypothetical protein
MVSAVIAELLSGRVDVKLYYLGILCILRFSSLSIEECHNIQPCKRTLRPSRNRTCGFPTSGSSAKLTHRTTVCEHTIHVTRSVPAKNIVTFLTSPLRYEGNIASVMLSISEYGIRYSSLCALLLTPSSVPFGTQWALPHLRLYYELVRLPYRHTSFFAFSTCWKLHYREQYGAPKFRYEPLNDPLCSANPARR